MYHRDENEWAQQHGGKLEETTANLDAAKAENARLCAELSKCQRQWENVNNRVMSSYEQL